MNRIMQDFPTVFDRQIRVMEVAEFRALLAEGAVPFSMKHHDQYHLHTEKLIVELLLLLEQGIIMLVAEVIHHEWCASIMMTSKKDTYHKRMYVDLSTLNRYVKRERYQ